MSFHVTQAAPDFTAQAVMPPAGGVAEYLAKHALSL